MGTFTVSTVMETVNVPIIGLAQARVSGLVSDPVRARMFLRAPEQDRNQAPSSVRIRPAGCFPTAPARLASGHVPDAHGVTAALAVRAVAARPGAAPPAGS